MMTDAEIDAMRRKAAKLLEQAAEATDLRERDRLVTRAADWHQQAVNALRMRESMFKKT